MRHKGDTKPFHEQDLLDRTIETTLKQTCELSLADLNRITIAAQVQAGIDRYRAEAMGVSVDALYNEKHDSSRLARHLEEAGQHRPRCHAHAIVAGRHQHAAVLRALMANLKIRIDDTDNGCWLPENTAATPHPSRICNDEKGRGATRKASPEFCLMIYRLKFDRNRFLSFDVTPEQWMEKLGPSYLFMLDEPKWSNFWPPINGQFFNHSDGDDLPSVPEICVWFMHDLVLNADVREALERDYPEWIQGCGELLPVKCEGIDYYVWHITHIVDDNCIDNIRSQRLIEESGHIELQALTFKSHSKFEQPLFHTSYDGAQALFCTDEFKKWVEGRGFKGLVFDTLLTTPF